MYNHLREFYKQLYNNSGLIQTFGDCLDARLDGSSESNFEELLIMAENDSSPVISAEGAAAKAYVIWTLKWHIENPGYL